ncbi:MAG: hypothetical protein SH850_10015 [Planctomycetaceae bacterium]|nr:hypothetical protein [Planctomycetaceae bacterium]
MAKKRPKAAVATSESVPAQDRSQAVNGHGIRRGCLGIAWSLAAKHAGLNGRNLDRASWEAKRMPDEPGESYPVSGLMTDGGFPTIVEIVVRWNEGNWEPITVAKEGALLFGLPKKG